MSPIPPLSHLTITALIHATSFSTWTAAIALPGWLVTGFAPSSIHSFHSCSSKDSPHTCSPGLPWELVRHEVSQAPPHTYWIWICVFNKSCRWFICTFLFGTLCPNYCQDGVSKTELWPYQSPAEIHSATPPEPCLQVYGFAWPKEPVLVRFLLTSPVPVPPLLL